MGNAWCGTATRVSPAPVTAESVGGGGPLRVTAVLHSASGAHLADKLFVTVRGQDLGPLAAAVVTWPRLVRKFWLRRESDGSYKFTVDGLLAPFVLHLRVVALPNGDSWPFTVQAGGSANRHS